MPNFDFELDASSPQKLHRAEDEHAAHHDELGVARALQHGRPDTLAGSAALHLQRAAGNAAFGGLMAQRDEEAGESVKAVVGSSGRSLPTDLATDMGARLGHDFSDVQVHDDAASASSAKAMGAHAYTVGNHLVFGEGTYQPDTPAGQRTLAHELTHVVQQSKGPVDGTPTGGGVKVSDPSDRFEREAAHTADLVMSGTSGTAQAQAGVVGSVQREAATEEGEEEPLQALHVQREETTPEEEEELQPT